MSMNEFRRMATRIDQQMQQLASEGVVEAPAVINRMMGHVPDLHRIWVGTSDQQLMALSREYPGFYRYALMMEEAAEAERNKPSRPYDGMPEFSEQHKQIASQLLTTAATLERRYQALRASGSLQVFQPQLKDLCRLHQQWLTDLEDFKGSLRAQGAEPNVLEYVDQAFGRMAERLQQLAGDPTSQTGSTAADNTGQTQAEPQWRPLAVLPTLTAAINGELQVNESLVRKLASARDNPHVLDDATIERIERMCQGQRDLLPVYRQQIERWRTEARSDAKAKAIREFGIRVERHAASTEALMALVGEFRGKTIDSVLGMGDAELALAVLSGQIKPPR